jgi:hypothetical protein
MLFGFKATSGAAVALERLDRMVERSLNLGVKLFML